MSYQYPGSRRPLKPRIHAENGKWRVSFPGISKRLPATSWDDAIDIVDRYYGRLLFLDTSTARGLNIARTFLGYRA